MGERNLYRFSSGGTVVICIEYIQPLWRLSAEFRAVSHSGKSSVKISEAMNENVK